MPEPSSAQLKPRINPSRSRTPSTFARNVDAGQHTVLLPTRCPFRMRVSISPKGSLIDITALLLPAGLHHAGNQSRRREVAQRDARKLKLAVIRSEEHTSELQSLMRNSYAVFCLKKKNKLPQQSM